VYRIAMIEDDVASAERVRQVLSGLSSTTTPMILQWHANSVAQARAHIADARDANGNVIDVDIVMLDLGLPDGRGVDLIPLLRTRWPACVIVAFTVFGDQSTVLEAIEAGVDGYLLKTADADELLDTLSSAAKGESPISSAVAGFLLRRLRKSEIASPESSAESEHDAPKSAKKDVMALTARERNVLEALARGFSYRETARRLNMSQHTVAHHVKNLYPKLTSTSRSEAVFRAVQEGIIKLD
jgi:DNA-binding NarL/FixJ family response regulator